MTCRSLVKAKPTDVTIENRLTLRASEVEISLNTADRSTQRNGSPASSAAVAAPISRAPLALPCVPAGARSARSRVTRS
jgi:hypothetical protein